MACGLHQANIRPRPVADRIFFAAETVTLFVIVALIATVLGVPAFIGAKAGFDLSWARLAALYLALLVCTSSVVTIWLCLLLVVARWMPLQRE